MRAKVPTVYFLYTRNTLFTDPHHRQGNMDSVGSWRAYEHFDALNTILHSWVLCFVGYYVNLFTEEIVG